MEYKDDIPKLNVFKSVMAAILTVVILTHPLFIQWTGFDVAAIKIHETKDEFEPVENVDLSVERGMYYLTLESYEQQLYDEIMGWINQENENDILIDKANYPEPHLWYDMVQRIYRMILLDNPQLQLKDDALKYGLQATAENFEVDAVRLVYNHSYIENEIDDTELMLEVERINQEISGGSNFQKIQYFYDYLVKTVTYSKDGEMHHIHSPQGALIDQVAVCDGIAETFKMLCDYAEIPCIVVVNGDHAWNVVYHGENLYHLDATWDLGKDKWQYFMLTYEELNEMDPDNHQLNPLVYRDLDVFFK